MAIFPGGPELANTRMSLFWILLKLRMIEVVAIAGAIRLAKLQSNLHYQQTSTLFFYRPDALASYRRINSVRALKGKRLNWRYKVKKKYPRDDKARHP